MRHERQRRACNQSGPRLNAAHLNQLRSIQILGLFDSTKILISALFELGFRQIHRGDLAAAKNLCETHGPNENGGQNGQADGTGEGIGGRSHPDGDGDDGACR
ncbi:hypothetical protein BRAS3809_550036 [Bradyrhizobium sp. STM 3809]|nr:hypothetical protein BRAS3809_550036 [Bradyrhizobium sp. STM 3809]